MQLQVIQNKIYEIRGQKVMLDFDLAELYDVQTKVFNQAVKRNIENFPDEFMFRLTKEEWTSLRSQIMTSNTHTSENQGDNWSQFVTSSKHRGLVYLPYAFTEHGVTMLASILKSSTARKMSIAIVRAFITMRKMIIQYADVIRVINELKEKVDAHDVQLNQIYEALENLLDKKVEEENKIELWKNREKIGFK